MPVRSRPPGADTLACREAGLSKRGTRGTHLGSGRERKVRRGLVLLLDAVILLPRFSPSLLWLEHFILCRFALPKDILLLSSRRHCSVAGRAAVVSELKDSPARWDPGGEELRNTLWELSSLQGAAAEKATPEPESVGFGPPSGSDSVFSPSSIPILR
nr:unnamed protein product [Digitaria exilis]